jgi:hypothetical protein
MISNRSQDQMIGTYVAHHQRLPHFQILDFDWFYSWIDLPVVYILISIVGLPLKVLLLFASTGYQFSNDIVELNWSRFGSIKDCHGNSLSLEPCQSRKPIFCFTATKGLASSLRIGCTYRRDDFNRNSS